MPIIPPDTLLNAYANGAFPMADGRDGHDIHWYQPRERGIIPLDDFHISRSLRKIIKNNTLSITCNVDFEPVMQACSAIKTGHLTARDETWINDDIIASYVGLHQLNHAHSVEVWDGDKLVGGLYGVSLGRAFFGESMFSKQPNASKIAMVYLVAMLKHAGFELLDCQYVNDHLLQFGCVALEQDDYIKKLHHAIRDVTTSTPESQRDKPPQIGGLTEKQWRDCVVKLLQNQPTHQ